ncbi:interleukin-10-like [Conger conger]|uniref:interleukin-10-like n=1 Tax=Conger conger TaxID=82655 RepID=UPI002A5AAE76|nr:interleukin-10-like [Conger conger]
MSLCRVSSLLLLALFVENVGSTATCRTTCCTFVQNFPLRLKQLRTSFFEMKEYYEEKDQVEKALLDESVLVEIKSPFGCHAVSDILRFYLEHVFPTVYVSSHEFKSPIDRIGGIFHELKRELIHCKDFFSCKKPFELNSIIDTYNKMQERGLYKAMRELEPFFNYIEEYMASKRHKSTSASHGKPSEALTPS